MFSTLFTVAFAEGEPEVEMSLDVSKSVSVYGAALGEEFNVDFNISFGDDLILRDGIAVLYAQIKFDPEVLEPVLNGEIYEIPADYVEGDALSVKLSQAGDTFTILYGTTNSANIIDTGRLLTLTFKAKSDLEVVDKIETDFRIVKPSAHGADMTYDEAGEIASATSFKCIVNSSNKTIRVIPPYKMKDISAKEQNSILSINGLCYIDENSEEPLMVTITDEHDNVVIEQEVTVANGIYRLQIELAEDTFLAGKYKLTLSHGVTSASKEFTVIAKDEPLPEEPDEPDEPIIEPDDNEENLDGDTSGDKDNDKDDNKTDNNTSTGGLTGGATSDKKPTVTDKTDKDSKDEDKSDSKTEITTPVKDNDVVYPTDIAGHWAKSNIEYVFDYKLMNGYADGTFGADNSITRAEFATVMSRFLGLAENPDAASAFADTEGHWAKGYIGALAAEGVVGGVSDDAFDPDSNITREQIAVILDRAFDLAAAAEKGTFADDAQISSWAYDGVYDVLAAGYMKGDTAGNFNPLANATRAEVATIIYRLHSAK